MLKIYDKLLNQFGEQNWWPVKQQTKDHLANQFEVCIGAILTQNTNWQNVEKAIDNLIGKNILSRNAIKNAKTKDLAILIRPSGYYKQKAKKLKAFVNFSGEVTRENLLSIWGIGPETADSILLYAYNKPYFVVDAYTKRIFTRLGTLNGNEDYEAIRNLFEKRLPKNIKLYKEFHALIVVLGKNYCKKKPLCKSCPLRSECKHK